MFGRSKAIVGLDIGSSAVKAVELKAAGKGYKVAAFGSEPIPPDSIVDGAIIDGGVVSDAIRRLFEQRGIKTKDVAASLSGSAGTGTDEDTVFQSDVQSSTGGVFEDQGTLTARLALKDPGTSGSPTTPTSANFITINRYRVVYVRTDGGAVPLPFEGAMTFTVTGGAAVAALICARSRLGQAAGAAHQPPGWRQLDCYLHGRRRHVLRSRPDRQGRPSPRGESA